MNIFIREKIHLKLFKTWLNFTMVLFLGLPIGFMNTRMIPSFKLPNKLLAAHTGLWAPMLYNQL